MDHTAIVRCDPQTDKQAIALAARAWPAAEENAYRQAIDQALGRSQKDNVVLLAAHSGERLLAAQLAQILPGRAALVWPPQFASGQNEDSGTLARALFARIAVELASGGARFAQSLLACSDDQARQLYSAGGFSHGGDLLYLTADLTQRVNATPQLPFDIEPFRTGDEPRLASLIERTYVGTLDCPGLDGLRQTADVIDGYKAVGEFRPELWVIARQGNEDIGCLLMNVHPDVRHAEIVYVALVPEMRRRGWGAELTRLALWLARRAVAERVVLAVDSANQPALRVYNALGFFEFDRRAVWIRSITGKSENIARQ